MKNKIIKAELYQDNSQKFKSYNIPCAQLVITDVPHNLGVNAYDSNPSWYNGEIAAMAKANLRQSDFLTVMVNLK